MHSRALREDDAGARPRRPRERLSRTRARRHPGDGQPDVGDRPAPQPPRRDRRPPGDVRDDLGPAQPPLRQRPAAPRLRRRGDRLLRRARRGRRRAREHRRLRPRRRAGAPGAGAGRRHPLRRPRPALPRGSLRAAPARGLGAKARPRCGDRWSAPRPDRDERGRPGVSYVLPLRWTEPGPIEELAAYLRSLAEEVDEILVVDGSPPPVFARARRGLGGVARHLAPAPRPRFRDGQGQRRPHRGARVLRRADRAGRRRRPLRPGDAAAHGRAARRGGPGAAAELLRRAALARPLGHRPLAAEPGLHRRPDVPGRRLPRHARRSPQRLSRQRRLRRRRAVREPGADADDPRCRRDGATPLDLYVARRPPSAAHFLSQRVRQAYDDFAIPARIGAFLALAPLAAHSAARSRRIAWLVGGACVGRRRRDRSQAGGRRERFPLSGSLLAPAWIAERSLCSWLALAAKLRGGVRYGPAVSATRRPRCVDCAAVLAGSSAGTASPLSARKPIAL